jgi:hypothetical protein
MNAPAAATTWEARPAQGHPAFPGAVRWEVVHVPTGRWMAFGSEVRCRQLAAHLTEADAILSRRGSAGTGPGSPDA